MSKQSRIMIFVLGSLLCAAANAEAPVAIYGVTETWHIGGEGRWDYAISDPAAMRLYVTRGAHVHVISQSDGKVIADIPNTTASHGVALALPMGRGFISDGSANTVTVFDLQANKTLGTVPTGKNPDAIVFDPASKKVFAFNGRSNDITVIDPAAEPGPKAVVATIPLDGKPEFAACDGAGKVFVNLEDKSSIVAIDSDAMKVVSQWKLDGGEEPSGLAIDAAHHRLFAGCGNAVMAVVDCESGKTLATVPIGKGVDACGFDPGRGEAFASCGDGTLTVIKETDGKFEVEQTVKTRQGARTMALDPTTHKVFLPAAEFEAAAAGQRRPPMKPDSFMIVVVELVRQ